MNSVHFKNKNLKIFLCFVLTAVLLISPASFSSAESSASIQNQISALEDEQTALKEKINGLKSKKDSLDEKQEAQQELVDNMRALVTACNTKLDAYNSEISALETKITQKENEIEDTKNQFKRRVRAMYMSGMNTNSLSVFLNSEDFSDMLAKNELLNNISVYDKALIEEITKTMKDIKKDKKAVEEKRAEQKALQQKLSSQLAQLDQQLSSINADINSLENQVEQSEEDYKKQQKEIAILQQRLRAQSSSGSSNIKFTSGKFTWPVPGLYNVTSGYGYRSGTYSGFHRGTDISGAGCYGKTIVAAADGVVVFAGFGQYGSGYGGYGNVVCINHGKSSDGNTYMSLYGHMAQTPSVSTGQTVKAGQTIGFIGSTGQSTGPHLHFEIFVNGSNVDPMGYFS